jgi:hypothetical protein
LVRIIALHGKAFVELGLNGKKKPAQAVCLGRRIDKTRLGQASA